jgi:hypothetical protein
MKDLAADVRPCKNGTPVVVPQEAPADLFPERDAPYGSSRIP